MNTKPVIGVAPLMDIERDSYWMVPGYMEGIIAAGGVPIILPLTEDKDVLLGAARLCGGFLFTGGHDISPDLYGEEKSEKCGEICAARDNLELELLDFAFDNDKPILGICRGIQFLNAVLGGTLCQDIPTELDSALTHCQKPPYDAPAHEIEIIGSTPLDALIKKPRIAVNSYHHQGIKVLSKRLVPMARAEDGLVEAVYIPDRKFVWGVQWHPEFSYKTDENSQKIFAEFVSAAKGE